MIKSYIKKPITNNQLPTEGETNNNTEFTNAVSINIESNNNSW